MGKEEEEERIKIDFSLRREVFFVVVGAIIGAITFGLMDTASQMLNGLPYFLVWVAFGHIVGVYSSFSASITAGITIHAITSIVIGILTGIFLYKTRILNISKISNGVLYGLFTGFIVFIAFFIPVYYFVLSQQMTNTMAQMHMSHMNENYTENETTNNFLLLMTSSLIIHLLFGITVGIISSLLSIHFGTRYRCSMCDISFNRIDLYQKHKELIHGLKPVKLKRILILGGGFAGIGVLQQLQKTFQDDIRIDITLVNRENFFLFTPMLPEVSSGNIETRNIVTPIRSFCKRAKFYEAHVEEIDLKDKKVIISHTIGKGMTPIDKRNHVLEYDYLVISLGSETNFFGNVDVEQHAFTMKSLEDALLIRNQVINMLEQADVEYKDTVLKKSLMTFVIVGGGFSGVETVGELNDFVHESINDYYHNLVGDDARIILVNSGERLLPEVPDDLAEFTLQSLRENGVEVMLNTRVAGATAASVIFNNGTTIACHTLIWTGGITPDNLISKIFECNHDKSGKIITNNYLQVQGWSNVFAIGDCAFITDPSTGKSCPPTAQYAIRQAKVASQNLISVIRSSEKGEDKNDNDNNIYTDKRNQRLMMVFDYKTKGIMALIGKRNGVGVLLGYKIRGFIAWWFWRLYYLGNLPTIHKKTRVTVDWIIDLLFKRDVTRLQTDSKRKNSIK